MNLVGILNGLSRLSFHAVRQPTSRSISTNITPLCFNVTNVLLGEPLKKKKRLDPQVIKHREDRKKRKLEKAIRRLEKNARQLKPISELEVAYKLVDESAKRIRKKPVLTPEQLEERVLLQKSWTRYKLSQHLKDMETIDNVVQSQQIALNELRKESEELYQAAIQIDTTILPQISRGPTVVHTPAIANYDTPDGEYHDITVKFEGEKTF